MGRGVGVVGIFLAVFDGVGVGVSGVLVNVGVVDEVKDMVGVLDGVKDIEGV